MFCKRRDLVRENNRKNTAQSLPRPHNHLTAWLGVPFGDRKAHPPWWLRFQTITRNISWARRTSMPHG